MLIVKKKPVKEFLDQVNVRIAAYGMLFYAIAELISDEVQNGLWFTHADNKYKNKVIFGLKLALPLAVFIVNATFCSILACTYKYWLYDQCVLHILKFVLPFFAVLSFTYSILTTILTFIMLVFIYPMWASSFLLLITVIFLAAYIIGIVAKRVLPSCKADKCGCKCKCEYVCSIIVFTIFFVVIICSLLVYLFVFELFIVYARGVANGGTVKMIILQLIPSVFVVFVLWLIRIMSNRISGETDETASGQQSGDNTQPPNQEEDYCCCIWPRKQTPPSADTISEGTQMREQDSGGTENQSPSHPENGGCCCFWSSETQDRFDEQQLTVQGGKREERRPLLNESPSTCYT